jgi:hypothetical protein
LKEKYRSFCENQAMPLFLQPWWLDAVCGESNWRPLLSFDKNGKVRGAMAIYEKQKYGMNWILQPVFTQFLGVWINYPPDLLLSRQKISLEMEVLNDLSAQFPDAAYVNIQCHFDLQNGMPFHWAGFHLGTKYTFFMPKETSIEDTFQQLRKDVRKNIRAAETTLTVEYSDDITLLYEWGKQAVERSGGKQVFTLAFLEQLDVALKKNGERHLLTSKDAAGIVHGIAYFVCDNNTIYLLASGINLKVKGASIVALVWEGIKLAKATNRGFDFEGSMLPHIEAFNRGFNGELRPYLILKKAKNKWIQAALSLVGRW